MCFLIVLYIFSKVVIRIFEWKVHTHQLDVLTVHQDRGSDVAFVDVLIVDDSFPPPFVQHNSNSVFVVVFSSSHEDVFKMCFLLFQPVHVSTFHSKRLRPICGLRVHSNKRNKEKIQVFGSNLNLFFTRGRASGRRVNRIGLGNLIPSHDLLRSR